jgi:hypothetical protein
LNPAGDKPSGLSPKFFAPQTCRTEKLIGTMWIGVLNFGLLKYRFQFASAPEISDGRQLRDDLMEARVGIELEIGAHLLVLRDLPDDEMG